MYHASIEDVTVYIEGMSTWPEEYTNKEVIVTGKLTQKNDSTDDTKETCALEDVNEIRLFESEL